MTTTNRTNTAPAWQQSQIYTAGDIVTIGSLTYQANWWTQGTDPTTHNGPANSGAPWTLITLASTPPAWSAGNIYTAGMTVLIDGVTYKANWWTQGANPVTNNGGSGSGKPWTIVGSVTPPPALPTVPTGLTASATTATSTALSWHASTVPNNGTVTGYAVFENGTRIATTTGTSYTVNNLAAGTIYNFAVAAIDSAGSSAHSAAVTVTTPPTTSTHDTWQTGNVYTKGMTVVAGGIIYQANWWTQGNDPTTNSGPLGTGEPWTAIGKVNTAPTVPDAPTGLAATATASTHILLTWNAATVSGSGTVSSYAILENGKQIATTTNTFYDVGSLTASTTYKFTVEAIDATGASPQSTAASATTLAPGVVASTGTFAPYIDMGLPQDQDLLAISQASGIKTFTLAFLQSSGAGTVGWSGVGTVTNDTPNGVSILTEVQRLEAAGGSVIISFGGAAGTDPAAVAPSAQALQAEYQSVIDRYGVHSLDFDIEGAEVADQKAITLRDQALVGLKAANPELTISFTLPVLPTGLDSNGLNVLQSAKHDGLNPDVVNIMTMDYGASVDNGGQMGADAISAALSTIDQIRFVGLSSTVGITPLIGVNDVSSETFTLADAQDVLAFAQSHGDITRIAMWSVARDNGSAPGIHYDSPTASGLVQSDYQFASIFKAF